MAEVVECRSDTDYADRPLAFQWEGQRQKVSEVVAQWRTPRGKIFRVQIETGQVFELVYLEEQDHWEINEIAR